MKSSRLGSRIVCVAACMLWSACSTSSPRSASTPASAAKSGTSGAKNRAISDHAPGWARAGDASEEKGHRLVCEGLGSSEEQALTTARAICDDKICKLCGVEIESVLQTTETLSGIEMERQVVERCRLTRQGEIELQRKSVDCQPNRCVAWILIDYPEALRERECKRFTDENFADPGLCQEAIEGFKNVLGYTALSFRERVSWLEKALTACAEIDVRPTPLMLALEEKLHLGMQTFRIGAPSYLANFWLVDHAPLWAAYRQSPSFTEHLNLLLGYLRSKVLLLDVLEAIAISDEELDTPRALEHLLRVMRAAPIDAGYGVSHVHMSAARRLGTLGRDKRLTHDISAINDWLRKTYDSSIVVEWDHTVAMYLLFGADDTLSPQEWQWGMGLGAWRHRFVQEVLKISNHQGGSRIERFLAAYGKARAEKPNEAPVRVFEKIVPSRQPAFILELEPHLPAEMHGQLGWQHFQKHLPSFDAWDSFTARVKLVQRMRQALVEQPLDSALCTELYKHLELLELYGVSTQGLQQPICGCLEGPLASASARGNANKTPLYQRALHEGMSCVKPLP